MIIYEVIQVKGGEVIKADLGNNNLLYIPKDPANSDYQRYLNPEAEQSTPNLSPTE